MRSSTSDPRFHSARGMGGSPSPLILRKFFACGAIFRLKFFTKVKMTFFFFYKSAKKTFFSKSEKRPFFTKVMGESAPYLTGKLRPYLITSEVCVFFYLSIYIYIYIIYII